VGFYFRSILVEELRDSELGWMTYKLFKFIDKTRMRGILKLFWFLLDDEEDGESIWVGFIVVLVYLGVLWKFFGKENGLL
jgi:hypothetical protein